MAEYTEGMVQVASGVWANMWPPGGWGQANTGLVVADSASMVVDTVWDTGRAERVAAQTGVLAAAAPVREAVNTHSDPDHWWGNWALPAETRITATARALEGMRREPSPAEFRRLASLGRITGPLPGPLGAMGAYTHRVAGGARFPARTPRLPDRTFTGQERLDLGGRTLQLREVGPAHTQGDLIVHVEDAGVVFAGDILFTGSTPLVWHGPLSNWLAALDLLLELDAAAYVPGHGPLAGAEDIRRLREYWLWVQEAGRERYDTGQSPFAAARQMMAAPEFAPWRNWDAPERLVISLHTLFRLWGGKPPEPPGTVRRARAFADAGRLLRGGAAR